MAEEEQTRLEVEHHNANIQRLSVLETEVKMSTSEVLRLRNSMHSVNGHLHEIKTEQDAAREARTEILNKLNDVDSRLDGLSDLAGVAKDLKDLAEIRLDIRDVLQERKITKGIIRALLKFSGGATLILGGLATFFYWAWDHIGLNHLFGYK